MKKIAVIGFGCAGYSAAKAIKETAPEIIPDIYSATEDAPYNPMLTTYFVSGKIERETMFPLGDLDKVRRELGANIFTRCKVVRLEAEQKTIVLDDGSRKKYDEIIIATGAGAVIPPIGSLPEKGIFTMRTAQDAVKLSENLAGVGSALVVGAQMVGIKVVELLHKRGIRVTLADMAKQMFPASAYPSTADIIAQRLTSAGIELKFSAAISNVTKNGDRLLSAFSDGSIISTDIVVFCSGIRPNIEFTDRSELEVGIGIKTDLGMRTNVPGIYAAGDCCETLNLLTGETGYIGLWANSWMQGKVAGINAAGGEAVYKGNLIHNITHYMDTDFISIGDINAAGEHIQWESRDKQWRMEATVYGGKILALNILDNTGVAGPMKNVLLQQAGRPQQKMSAAAKLVLQQSGMPAEIIKKLGGA